MNRLEHTRRPVKALAVTAIAAAALVLGPVAAADAATSVSSSDVLISTDGVSYAASATSPLFAGDYTIVPGDTQAAELYVRNATPHDAVLTIYVTGIAVSQPVFAHSLTLQASTPTQGATPVVGLATASSCQVLLENEQLPAGQTVRAALTLAMADVAGTTAQNESANFHLRVTLRDAAQPAPASGCADGTDVPAFEEPATDARTPSGPASHHLARTGAEARYPLIAGGLIFGLGTTFVLFAALRRRERRQ
jgi:hypothetical protein